MYIHVDNTMADRKRTKGQTQLYKTLQNKLEIDQHDEDELRCYPYGKSVFAPQGGLSVLVTLVTSSVISWSVRNYMDVNEHEKLSSITHRRKNK